MLQLAFGIPDARGNLEPATSRPSLPARKSCVGVLTNGGFPATSLNLSLARPGQFLTLTTVGSHPA